MYQCGHVVSYVAVAEIEPAINTVAHGIALAGYVTATAWLFRTRWIEARSQPPNRPDDD